MALSIRLPFTGNKTASREISPIVESPFPDIAAQQRWAERVQLAASAAEAAGLRRMHPCGMYVMTGELKNASSAQLVAWAEGND